MCNEIRPNTFVTLVTNHTRTTDKMKELVGKYFKHMDRWYLGHTWLQQPIQMRTDGIGFIEHVNSNIHTHLMVRFAKGNFWGRRIMSELCWNKICEGGSVDLKPITNVEKLASYCTKEMTDYSHSPDNQIIFLRDYFPV